MLEPCVDLTPLAQESAPAALESRLFGRPCLQHMGDWPRNPEGRPLGFIGQLNLGAMSARVGTFPSLPEHGLLSLFYDLGSMPDGSLIDHRYGFRVLWAPNLDGLSVIEPPLETVDFAAREWLLGASRRMRLPSEVDAEFLLGQLSESEYLAYDALASKLAAPAEHRLLGPADWLEGDARAEVERITAVLWPRNSSSPSGTDWRLLWQIGGEPHLSEALADEVRLYVLIRNEDLVERRFLRAWVVLQRG